jgi:hypothetical protein
MIECYNQLINIRHRFTQNKLIGSQVDLTLKQDFSQDKQMAVLELIQ